MGEEYWVKGHIFFFKMRAIITSKLNLSKKKKKKQERN